jgi:deazaflavin-dependent oxidoreductase (nitroreductase family)
MVDNARHAPAAREHSPHLQPRWFIRAFWAAHRAVYRTTGGRIGLRRPTPTRWGMLRLRTVGRRTGDERSAILGYYEDGPNLVTMAMNGWAPGEPSWWLNLQAHADATVDLVDGPRKVTARAAVGEERARLWAGWRDVGDDVDAYAPLRASETAVVVLEPRSADPSLTHRAGGPAATRGEKRMNTDRRIAVVAGVAFIIATVAQLAGVALYAPILNAPDYLTKISANESQVLLGTFLYFIGAVACTGIALALYPVLRRYNEGLALGSVAFRTIEGALYVLSAVGLMLLVTLSREFVTAGAPASSAYDVQGVLLKAGRDWLGPVAVLTFGLGGLMYYLVFYQSRLVPRWLSAWGLVAIALVMVSGLLVMLRLTEPLSTTQVVLALPIAVQEMVLAVWLIAKGFNPSAIVAESAGRASMPRAAASAA